MKFIVRLLLLFFTFFAITLTGYASGMLSGEEMDFIDRMIIFLENIDLDGIHIALTAIITTLLVLLRLFKKRLKKAVKLE